MPGIFNWIRPNVLLGDSEPRNAGYFQHLFLAQVGHGWHLCRIRGNLLASPSKRRDVLAGQHFQHRGRNKLSLAWQVALYSAPGQSGRHARRGWWTRDVEPVRGRLPSVLPGCGTRLEGGWRPPKRRHAGRPLKTLEPGCEGVGLFPAAINGQLTRSNCTFDI